LSERERERVVFFHMQEVGSQKSSKATLLCEGTGCYLNNEDLVGLDAIVAAKTGYIHEDRTGHSTVLVLFDDKNPLIESAKEKVLDLTGVKL